MAVSTDLFDLTGKVALITGGATGIGLAIAEAMVRHGAKVVVGSRTLANVEKAVTQLNTLSDPKDDDHLVAAGVALDVTNPQSVEHAVRKAMDVFGGLRILVNSAGIMLKKPAFDLTPEEFNNLHDIHVTGSLRAAQAAGRIFREQHEGCIINLASINSFNDIVGVPAYAIAKTAVMGLTRSLANEWARFGIRTNAIAPGVIPTDLNRKLIEGTDRGRRLIERTPMARFGGADEIAGAAIYLAARAGSFTNGHTIVVDGGFCTSGITEAVAPWAEQPSA
ncbi:MAG: SDR family oxidoreductase [Phycisphaeraceae bacterium]|nr:SDR family oxidoreductase [Phycisphaeraceae bacterium]